MKNTILILAFVLSSSALLPATGKPSTDVKADAALSRLTETQKYFDTDPVIQKVFPLESKLRMFTRILDCKVAVFEKHNREFPGEPWASAAAFRDKMVGKPDAERIEKANKCAELGGVIQP